MATGTPAVEKSNGLANVLAVITSPSAAFEQLARTPTWGWAALVCIALLVAATLISFPEQVKVAHVAQAAALANMSADQQAQARQNMAAFEGVTRFFILAAGFIGPWIVWLISAIVFTIGAAIGGGTSRFSLAWVASVNAAVVAFIAAVVNAVILALRGPDAIGAPLDAYTLPSLGMLVHGSVKFQALLNTYNVGNLWYYVVGIIALERMLNVRRPVSIVVIVVYSLITAGFAAAFAK